MWLHKLIYFSPLFAHDELESSSDYVDGLYKTTSELYMLSKIYIIGSRLERLSGRNFLQKQIIPLLLQRLAKGDGVFLFRKTKP